jgi:hypothetical protein
LVHVRQRTVDFDACVDAMTRVWPTRGRATFVGARFESTINAVVCGPATFSDNFCTAGLRLDEARRQLVADSAVTVTSVAMGLGFNHMGRFSRDYRRRFGESPSRTFRRGEARLSG